MAEEKKGFFGRLRDRLSKTRTGLVDNVRRVLTGRTAIDDDLYEELEAVLIQADIGVETTLSILEDMKRIVRERRIREPEELLTVLKNELAQALDPGDHTISFESADGPHIALIVGVNGSGKTTTIGKLAHYLKGQDKSVLLGAGDTFRAAAVDQLTVWSERVGVPIVKHKDGGDPAAVAYDAVDAAMSRKTDVVLIDTAGRLHTKVNLMEELKKVTRVVQKRLPSAPHSVLLVLDATTGQNGLQQAKIFTEAMNVTGIVLTKLDGTAKGGVVLAIQRQLGIPIKMIGVGEAMDDLQPFQPAQFVEALFS